jgi:hypothetical protein
VLHIGTQKKKKAYPSDVNDEFISLKVHAERAEADTLEDETWNSRPTWERCKQMGGDHLVRIQWLDLNHWETENVDIICHNKAVVGIY